jgi:hypothetical protein
VKLSIEMVILLVVTIAIVGGVAAWAMGYIGASMAGTPDFTAQVQQCLTSKVYVQIKNLATVDIVGVSAKLSDGTSLDVKYADGTTPVDSAHPIKPGDTVQVVITNPNGNIGNVGDRVTITITCKFADGKLTSKDVTDVVRSF